MNLFEDWDATEKRSQQQQKQQKQLSYRQGSATQQLQQLSTDPRDVGSSASQPQRRTSATSVGVGGMGGSVRASGWGKQASPTAQLPKPSSEATAVQSISGGGSSKSSTTNARFPAATSSTFVSANPFVINSASGVTSSNPFASANTNPFATSSLMGSASTGGGGPRSGRSGFGDASSVIPTKHGDPPIFSLQCLALDDVSSGRSGNFRGSSASWSILAVAVGNGMLAMATSDCRVLRWNVERDGRPEELEISKRPEDTIHKIFLDPTGNHLLACLHGGETYYLHSTSARPKRLLKWSGVVVEAVAFDSQRCTEGSTKGIVVGTRSGDLYESSLESNGKERPFSLVYTLGRRQTGGVTGSGGGGGGGSSGIGGGGMAVLPGGGEGRGGSGVVAALHLESMSSAVHGETKVFLMAVTTSPLRLYIFMGGPTLEVMFREHRESGSSSFQELPGSMLGTELHVYRRASRVGASSRMAEATTSGVGASVGAVGAASAHGAPAGLRHITKESTQSFALLTSMGIYNGSLALDSEATPDNVIADAQLSPYPYPERREASLTSNSLGGGGGGGGLMGGPAPLSMAITEFHFLLLFTDRLEVVSRLNGAVVQEESLEAQDATVGHVLTMLTDPYTGGGGAMQGGALTGTGVANRLWLFTDRLPFKVRVSHEDRDVWMLFLEKALAGEEEHFESAAQHCKNATERAQVHYVQAGWYFRRGQHTLAARYYAKTPCCFEEIALKFMECEDGWKATALKTYLLERLRHLSMRQGEHKTQKTMLCTWLTELYLRGFTYLPLEPGSGWTRYSSYLEDCWLSAGELSVVNAIEKEKLEAEFSLAEELRSFLRGHATELDPATTMDLLSAHGRSEEALFYATLVQDYERVVAHHANRNSSNGNGPDFKAALDVLRKAPFDKVEHLVYKYSAALMAADPLGTIETWMSKPQLKPTKLIPALVRYSERRMDAMMHDTHTTEGGIGEGGDLAIKYLEFCVNDLKLKDAAVHNHLLALYAQEEANHDLRQQRQRKQQYQVGGGDGFDANAGSALLSSSTSSPAAAAAVTSSKSRSALLEFIARPSEERHFDPMYALRLCAQHGRSLAMVHLYSAMGLWEEAVDLALAVDTDLAKVNANKAPEPETRKLLWLKIARREVERCRGADIEDAMRVLQECDLLKIEDILPFFPDFVVIDSFKREICVSLEEYNGKIEGLRKEMEDYTVSTETVQAEIEELKKRSIYVSSNQTCELCGRNILSTQFYVFPCNHAFHAKCLMDHILPHLTADQQATVTKLLGMIAALRSGSDGKAPASTLGLTGAAATAVAAAAAAGAGRGFASGGGGGFDKKDGTATAGSKRAHHNLRALQMELDGYVAAECVLCGDIMVQSVGKPLVSPEEEEELSNHWAL